MLLKNDCFTYASTSLLAFATHEQIAYGVTVTPSLPPCYPTLVVTTGTILQTHGIPIHTDTVTLCDDGSL